MTRNNKSHSCNSLIEWLSYLENLHNVEIDLGLERVSKVAELLAIDLSFASVVTVAGTNGKGTTCAFIENALLEQRNSVAVYSSPHIHCFNERLRINKRDIDDESLIAAFHQIEQTRGDISLSYYEYTTLAAFLVMMVQKPDVIVLEVGLGGRLDATNIIDADIAVITTVDLDHQAFLGNDRETIGFEKAGIMRKEQFTVVGDVNPPNSVLDHATKLNAKAYVRNKAFSITGNESNWNWQHLDVKYTNLPQPHIPKDNVATALMVLTLLAKIRKMSLLTNDNVIKLIQKTKVAGRTERVVDGCQIMLDVGHNPLAARYLADQLAHINAGEIHAVVGMLSDKDIKNTLGPLNVIVDHWYLATLSEPRGASSEHLASQLPEGQKNVLPFDNVSQGYRMAKQRANKNDLIIVFGSFYTVAHVKKLIN